MFGAVSPSFAEFGRLRSKAFRSTSSTRAREKPRSLRCGLRTKERYPARTSRLQTTTPRRHQFHSSLMPPHAHHSTRETLRVDLAQTGAVPIRLSNTAIMRTTLQSFARSGFQCCGNRLTSTRLFFSIVEKCLAFATGRKNRPTGEAPSSRPPRPFWAGRDAPVLGARHLMPCYWPCRQRTVQRDLHFPVY
jgi:hypothetical protein